MVRIASKQVAVGSRERRENIAGVQFNVVVGANDVERLEGEVDRRKGVAETDG